MSPPTLVLGVALPALLAMAYGMIKARRRLLRESVWAGLVAGVAVAVAVLAWELALDWLLTVRDLPPASRPAWMFY